MAADYSRSILELQLNALHLNSSQTKQDTRGIIATLIAPRLNINERTTIRIISLAQGQALLQEQTYHERILFKEIVEGPFGIRFAITENKSTSFLQSFFAHLTATSLETAGHFMAAQSPPWVRSLIRQPFNLIADELKPSQKQPKIVADADINLDSKPIARKRTVKLPLLSLSANDRNDSQSHRHQRRYNSRKNMTGSPHTTSMGTIKLSYRILSR